MLCQLKSGYMENLIINTGQETCPVLKLNKMYCKLHVSLQIIISLVGPLSEKEHFLIIDNVYISPQLADFRVSYRTSILELWRNHGRTCHHN